MRETRVQKTVRSVPTTVAFADAQRKLSAADAEVKRLSAELASAQVIAGKYRHVCETIATRFASDNSPGRIADRIAGLQHGDDCPGFGCPRC